MERVVTYIDPDLWVAKTGETEIDGHFVCVICCGVVIDPTECAGCESLFCRNCLTSQDIPCPKRCGSSSYTKVNRFIMNTLNKMEFKCQSQPKCTEVVKYEDYSKHIAQCEYGKPEDCKNPDC